MEWSEALRCCLLFQFHAMWKELLDWLRCCLLFQFHAMWKELLDWLREAEKTLDAHQQVGNDPIKIKAEIAKHKVND